MKFRSAVLVFVVQDGRVLLAEKLDKIGQGKLNGYGGKPNEGESLREAACREFREETGGAIIDPADLVQAALTKFRNEYADGSSTLWTIYVYTVSKFIGAIFPTKEMGSPEWYPVDQLPFDKLLPADKFWLPQALSGKQVYVTGSYGVGLESLLGDVMVEEVQFRLEW